MLTKLDEINQGIEKKSEVLQELHGEGLINGYSKEPLDLNISWLPYCLHSQSPV